MSLLTLWWVLIAVAGMTCRIVAAAPGEQEDDGAIFEHNERDAAGLAAARAQVPMVELSLPADRLDRLPRTMRALRDGGTLRVVMLGDSIVNDTARSAWHELVEQRYPGADIVRIVSVRGGTGCWWYKLENRIERFVVQQRPDLVIIGGISQRHDTDSIRACIHQIRARLPEAELLLMTGAYGTGVDPLSADDWRIRLNKGKDQRYAQALKTLADETGAAFLDQQQLWGQYLRELSKPVETYMRDPVHANAIGEAVLGRIMEQFFAPQATGARP